MLESDFPLWNTFLDSYAILFERFFYNVLVGEFAIEVDRPLTLQETLERSSLSKKIDALGETSDNVWIIEVASRPGLRSIGQLLTYRALWLEDPKILKPEITVLVTDILDRDLISSASVNGIETVLL